MPEQKPQLYRIASEGQIYIGQKEEVNKLPEAFKQLFLKAMKQGADGKRPDPFSVPPKVLTDAGFQTEEEFRKGEQEELEELEEVETQPLKKPIPSSEKALGTTSSKSFVDILADKIANKILERLLK